MFFNPRTLLLLLLALAAWYFWARVIRVIRRGQARSRDSRETGIEDMVQCRVCGTYLAAGSARCARADCPVRGR